MALKKQKVCFAASSGGHLEQLMLMKPLMDKYDSFIVTEQTSYHTLSTDRKTYYLKQINRKEKLFPLLFAIDTFRSIRILIKERPKVIVTTGVLAVVPICVLGKLFGAKILYLESFAKINSGTMTGKLLYKFADKFYVQWENMMDIYPGAVYTGGIY